MQFLLVLQYKFDVFLIELLLFCMCYAFNCFKYEKLLDNYISFITN